MAVSDDAVEFLRLVQEADSVNRQEGLEDLKFRFGDQWPVQMQNSRQLEGRPMLTINETDSYCRQVVNNIRQQRPRGKCHPVNSTSDPKIAEVITGIGRHIEVNSDASVAYDLAAEFAVTMGVGYWRVAHDYIREDSFDQDIYVRQLDNPFAVYFDPQSILPDGSDAEKVLITDNVLRSTFERLYPGAAEEPFREGASGDQRTMDWLTKETIRVAEYFRVEKRKAKLVMLSNGKTMWASSLPPNEALAALALKVTGDRESYKREVFWSKVTATQELDKRVLPGRWIPVVPVYGVNLMIDGKRRKFGMVRFARDPQRMVNYWQTNLTEVVAMAPKAKWLVPEGGDEGHENEYAQANIRNFPVLRFKTTGVDGRELPAPEYIQPEGPPQGVIAAALAASENLQRVLGMFDPVNLKHTGPKSGEALKQEMGQSEQSNYHFYDNLTQSIKHTWRIFLDWTPVIYDSPGRVMRVIGEDGKPSLKTLNDRRTIDGVERVLNDVTVGEYDVVMETGPGFNTKRQEGFTVLSELLSGPLGNIVAPVGADLIIRMLDAPGADILADRLAAANPLAQIDQDSDIPPKIQMMIKQLQQQVQTQQQALQAAGQEIKSRQSVQEIKEHGAILRERMQQEGDAKEREITRAQKQHDTETRALTAQNVAEINALAKLFGIHVDNAHQLHQMLHTFRHETELKDKELKAKENEKEPVAND